jgi:hypothetical protein
MSSAPSAAYRRTLLVGAAATLLVGLIVIAVLETEVPSATEPPVPQPPLPSGTATSAGSWVVLPLGQLSSEMNTFWQLLHAPSGSAKWSPVTPEGTADNGGLVAGMSGGRVVAGVLTSGLLTFSPLALSVDGGGAWSPVFLPGAVARAPDALALDAGASGRVLAVVGSRVMVASSAVASWSTLVSLSTLRRVSQSCGARRLQAVAFAPAESPLVGVQCRHGLGLFTYTSTSWRYAGPQLGEGLRAAPTSIVRLVRTGSATVALVATVHSGRTRLLVLWKAAAGRWTISPSLQVPDAGPIATSVAQTGEIAVLVGSSHGSLVEEVAPNTKWTTLPAPPRGTVALAPPETTPPTSSGQTTLFTVHGAEFAVYVLSQSGSSWQEVQSSNVPLAYGSSS